MSYNATPVIMLSLNLDDAIKTIVDYEVKRREKENATMHLTKGLDDFKTDLKRFERKLKKKSRK